LTDGKIPYHPVKLQFEYHRVSVRTNPLAKILLNTMQVKIAVVFLLFLVLATLAVRHYSPRRDSVVQTQTAATKPETPVTEPVVGLKSLQDQLSSEQARLDTLQSSLDQISERDTSLEHDDVTRRLPNVRRRIQQIEQQIAALAQDGRETMANALSYQSSVQMQKAGAVVSIEQQVRNIDNAIAGLEAEIAKVRSGPTRDVASRALQIKNLQNKIAEWKTARDRVLTQRRILAAKAQATALAAEQELRRESENIQRERQSLESELKDLRSQEASLSQQVAKPTNPDSDRMRELQNAIADQKAKIDELRNQYAQKSAQLTHE
jgi:DNA repair exonuclease SbcCD ATPase subunit